VIEIRDDVSPDQKSGQEREQQAPAPSGRVAQRAVRACGNARAKRRRKRGESEDADGRPTVQWQHENPLTGSLRWTEPSGVAADARLSTELDPLGANARLYPPLQGNQTPPRSTPWQIPSKYSEILNGNTGCTVDGMVVSCERALQALQDGWAIKAPEPEIRLGPFSRKGDESQPMRSHGGSVPEKLPSKGDVTIPISFEDNSPLTAAEIELVMELPLRQKTPQNIVPPDHLHPHQVKNALPSERLKGPCARIRRGDLDFGSRRQYGGKKGPLESGGEHIMRRHINPANAQTAGQYTVNLSSGVQGAFRAVKYLDQVTFMTPDAIQYQRLGDGKLVGIAFIKTFNPSVAKSVGSTNGGIGTLRLNDGGGVTLTNILMLRPDCKTVDTSYPGTGFPH
jgi:hypothetical protein